MSTDTLSIPPAPVLTSARGPLVGWLLAALAHVVAQVAASVLVPLSPALLPPPEQAAAGGLALLGVSAVHAALLTAVVRRSVVGGWPLVRTLVFVWWGLATFMTQIETAWFLGAFPLLGAADLARLFVSGFVLAALWIPLAVKAAGGFDGRPGRPASLPSGLGWRLAVLAPLYAAIYFTFGYYVAWQWTDVRVFYAGDATLPSFAAQLASNAAIDPWLYPFQVLRGVLWALVAAPAALLFRRRWEAVLFVGLLCGLAPTVQLLHPNVLMPGPVRLAHFLEVSSSTALFGVAVALLLRKR